MKVSMKSKLEDHEKGFKSESESESERIRNDK